MNDSCVKCRQNGGKQFPKKMSKASQLAGNKKPSLTEKLRQIWGQIEGILGAKCPLRLVKLVQKMTQSKLCTLAMETE